MSARPRALAAALFAALAAFGAGCDDDDPPAAAADQASVEGAIRQRMGAVKHCWTAGDEKSSHLAGEAQKLVVDVLRSGKVRVTFQDEGNAEHPVGRCMRSALDGLRFAPREEAAQFEVEVRLGKPAR